MFIGQPQYLSWKIIHNKILQLMDQILLYTHLFSYESYNLYYVINVILFYFIALQYWINYT